MGKGMDNLVLASKVSLETLSAYLPLTKQVVCYMGGEVHTAIRKVEQRDCKQA